MPVIQGTTLSFRTSSTGWAGRNASCPVSITGLNRVLVLMLHSCGQQRDKKWEWSFLTFCEVVGELVPPSSAKTVKAAGYSETLCANVLGVIDLAIQQ
jgi:hypothetical protein